MGRAANNLGEYVCTSGSFSGVRCNIKIVDDSQTVTISGHSVPYIVEAYRMDGTAATGEGDSGGPVFALSSNPAKVIARGTISAGKHGDEVACVGVGGRTCWKTVRYMPISVSLNNWAMTLNLGN